MLALHDNSQVYGTYPEGGWFTLPNGDRVSPAFSGWTGDDDLQLSEIAVADPVPSGKVSTGQVAQMVEGGPKWVHSLEDAPIVPRTIAGAYFRAALTDMGEIDRVRSAIPDAISLELFNTATEFNDQDSDVNAVATALSIDLGAVFDAAEAIRAARQG
jgi:hypothetical protein